MNKQKILIAEPDPMLLESAAKILLSEFCILRAQTQYDGLSVALAESPNLLISHLPHTELSALLTKLGEAGQSVPVILAVDNKLALMSVDLLRLGIKNYVTVPYQATEVHAKVDQVLRQTAEDMSESDLQGSVSHLEFADMASHLLRNPLNVIQTSVRCLQALDLGDQEREQLYRKIWDQSQRLSSFTTELLQILQPENDDTFAYASPVALLPVVERVLSLVQSENPDLEFQLIAATESIPTVVADATKTEMVLFNMLTGAVRESEAGRCVTVFVNSTEAEVTVTIEDDGRVRPEKSAEIVFKPYTGEESKRVVAPAHQQLGYRATKRLVKSQNGQIFGSNLAEPGSQLSFSLPTWR